MKISVKLATLFATGSLLLAGTPAFAASAMTDAFVANVRPNVDFLDSSSRLAIDVSGNPRIRAFARAEATEQTIAGNALVAWTETNTPTGEAAALGTPVLAPLTPVADLAFVPLNVANNVTGEVVSGVGTVVTGRSVAIDQPVPLTVAPPARPADTALLPSEQTDLSRLKSASGRSFDRLYVSTQVDALRQLAILYGDYSRDGDDPALRTLAAGELPKINRRIAELSRI